VNLDDEGSVPISYFGACVDLTCDVRLDNYAGVINRTHTGSDWGSTNYAAAIAAAVAEHDASGATDPGLVIFQTDGEPDDPPAAEHALRHASTRPLFFAFVGFGPERNMLFLKTLDTLPGRTVDNASFFHAANPGTVTDGELYDGITREFATWLSAARTAGIVQ
ncbi:VWA domain-containing protein, partial [Streptomyces graminilatus]|uniref:VWA domain-containing protein n=1 Tax=Streptomyces graminilatus TaxID=1464070 RepID=UPI00099EFEF2